MNVSKEQIQSIVSDVLKKYMSESSGGRQSAPYVPPVGTSGIFPTIADAVEAAYVSQKQFVRLSLETRANIIEAMRRTALSNVRELAEMAVAETGMGRVEDKIIKKTIVAKKTPGLEDLNPIALTGDGGLTLIEQGPFGLIGSITPSTNPAATVINNSISMIAAGNGVVFNFHPAAKKVSQQALRLMNEAICSAGGPANLLVTVEEPTMQSGLDLMTHPKIRLLVVQK